MTTDPTQTPEELATIPAAGATPVPEQTAGDGITGTEPAPRVMAPTLCRDVWYADKQVGGSVRAAKVVGTRDSIAHDEGVPLPESDMHVHLLVFPPAGSAYNAHDVAYDANGAPGTWRWPTRVGA
jgi:hypothetical protein